MKLIVFNLVATLIVYVHTVALGREIANSHVVRIFSIDVKIIRLNLKFSSILSQLCPIEVVIH